MGWLILGRLGGKKMYVFTHSRLVPPANQGHCLQRINSMFNPNAEKKHVCLPDPRNDMIQDMNAFSTTKPQRGATLTAAQGGGVVVLSHYVSMQCDQNWSRNSDQTYKKLPNEEPHSPTKKYSKFNLKVSN
jgi:hypothetical protein